MLPLHTLLSLLAVGPALVTAHATLISLSIAGKDQGKGADKYIRAPATNDPIRDLTSPNIICNTNGGKPAPSFVKAAAGDKLTMRWWHYNPDDPNDYPLDPSHKGALLTYVAPYTTGDGQGGIWTKIAEDGFEGGKWATEKLIANNGNVEVTLPSALAAGRYLVRQEIVALHQADFAGNDPAHPGRGAELYPGCAQVEVTGDGGKKPDQGFDFNKGYKYDDKGLHFNIYVPFDSYTPPGPRPWKG
ncbi:glycoside hydrolase [Chaetomium sp. MPI-SDFR-AT-0129]|nr:glycoside hydrolase [Chaetomium sp. MPI-SDFR-AT-0129]